MPSTKIEGAQWLSGRVFDLRPKGHGFKPHRRHCVVSLSKNINPILVLVQPRKIRPFITERLLMGRKEANQTNKSTKIGNTMTTRAKNKNIFECHQQINDLHMYKDSDERFRALLLAHLSRRLMGSIPVTPASVSRCLSIFGLSTISNIFSSETTGLIKFKFHMETP